MPRSTAFVVAAILLYLPAARAEQPAPPLLALWEYDGWAAPTAERPLGLRFVLLADGRILFSPDDPASDRLIPAGYFQAQLSPGEMETLADHVGGMLAPVAGEAQLPELDGDWTAFYFRDPVSGAAQRVEVAGHPCLARYRVFSATAPVDGLRSARNSADRAALPPALREVCNLLTGFHHASAVTWNPAAFPAPLAAP